MVKKVSVNLFDMDRSPQTVQSLSDTIREYGALPLSDRWRGDIRLEMIDDVPADGAMGLPPRLKLDFAKRRTVGPGKLGHSAPVSPIQMGQGEDFGEETAAIYVPSKKWLLVLHNQAGIGPSRMAEYFNAIDPGNSNRTFAYSASPVIDPTVLTRLGGMKHLTKVELTATLDALNAAQAPLGISVARATEPAKAKKVSLIFSANVTRARTNFLSLKSILPLLKGLAGQADGVSKLMVFGEDPASGKRDEAINLLEHKLKQQYRETELQVVNHRYTLASRWALIDRALRGWI